MGVALLAVAVTLFRLRDSAGFRLLAHILGAMVDHGEEVVAASLEATLRQAQGRLLQAPQQDLSATTPPTSPLPQEVPVPQALQGYLVEGTRAEDYDALLLGGAR